MLAAGLASPAAVRTVGQRASPSGTLGAHPTGATAVRRTVVAAIPLAVPEERAKCSAQPAPAVVRRPRCHSSPAGTSPSTARRVSSSAVAAPTIARVVATATVAAVAAATKTLAPEGTQLWRGPLFVSPLSQTSSLEGCRPWACQRDGSAPRVTPVTIGSDVPWGRHRDMSFGGVPSGVNWLWRVAGAPRTPRLRPVAPAATSSRGCSRMS